MTQTGKGVSRRQVDILRVIEANGPIAPSDLPYHLPGYRSVEAYSAACARLEARGLLAAQYTGHTRRGRTYVITERGAELTG